MKNESLLIWTPDGCWLQTYGEGGAMRLSGMGKLPLHAVEGFCRNHAIGLEVRVVTTSSSSLRSLSASRQLGGHRPALA